MVAPLADLLARAALDPLVRAALLAAGVLAAAALVGGWSRRDVHALGRPATWLALAVALLAALAFTAAGDRLAPSLPAGFATGFEAGWERVPLALLALGYGPSVGLLAGLLTTGVQAGPWTLGAAELSLILELALIGWLGLGPSPRRARWAGPLAVVSGWLLATATLGLAGWAADGRPIALRPFLQGHLGALGSVLLAAALAATVPPTWWRRRVPGAAPRVRMLRDEERVRWLRPLPRPPRGRARRRRAAVGLQRPHMPPRIRRPRRPTRALEPVMLPDELQRPDADTASTTAGGARPRHDSGSS